MIVLLLLAGCPKRPEPPAPGSIDATFTDDTGLTGRYNLIIPPTTGASPGVLLFFNWDGGAPFYAQAATDRAEIAAAHGLIVVSMANPDDPAGNHCWWAPEVQRYAHYVDRFVTDVLVPNYAIDTDRVFTTGLSGGSDFAAAFPYHTGYRYGGGAVALCGGDIPRLDGGDCATEADPPAAPPVDPPRSALDAIRYDFAIDATDPLLAASQAAAAYYEAAGFTHVQHHVVAGHGHCGFADGFEGLDELRAGLCEVDSSDQRAGCDAP